ncbi:early nodulin-like protein 3 [Chenopodium quinoa]|uniref:early nodulin-like protein 3 n=1 Tax=Chenopodium quinoa TaxID=63459 RepID=UPI000B774DA5|nr:early nodulin-like protein 3 [Chenopodium quinoa]
MASRIFFSVSLVLTIALFSSFAEAKDHLVGGTSDAWKVPSSQSDSLNKWAEKQRFQIGDNLVWKYDNKQDSVLQVTREAYLSCNTSSPVAEYKDGQTKVELKKPGPYYFISGTQANCEKGEKVIVVVMSARSRRSGAASPAFAPSPSPNSEAETPAVAPTSGASGAKGSAVMVVVGVLAGFLMM